MVETEELLSVADVAARLGISTQMVSYYHRQRELGYRAIGKAGRGEKRLTPTVAIEEFLRRHPTIKKEN